MESPELLETSIHLDASLSSCNSGTFKYSETVEENENLGVDILNDLDTYWEDIKDRLVVSRIVSDSVVKGMISAVEQEAAEKIAQKESELDKLKETLHLYHVGTDENGSMRHSMICHEPKSRKYSLHSTHSNGMLDHEKLQDIGNLKFAAKDQFKKLKKEIDKIRKGSGSLGLSGILQDNMSDKWIDVDRALDSLRTTLESTYVHAEDMVYLSKSLVCDCQQEREFQAEIEGIVIKNCIQSVQEDFEQRLWDLNARSYGNESVNWLEKIKEISSLRQELDAISKSLAVHESGHLISHGSLEHRKPSVNHVSSSSLREGNGKHDESTTVVPENMDYAQLKHFSKEELFHYCKAEMTKMKRDHELKVQQMTEEYFSLKREYLKERGSSLPVRKDKEFDSLRKKIPEVILKLDDILMENEKLPSFTNNGDCLNSLKDRLESLSSENRHLRDLLMDKRKEIKCLSSQVSDAAEKILEHSLAEEKLSRMLEDLKCVIEDANIEASISDDLYQFLVKEVVSQMKSFIQELNMEHDIIDGIYEIIFKEATHDNEPSGNLEIEDSVIESIITQGICEVIFRESFKEAEEKVGTWNLKYINENKLRLSLEMQASEKERELRLNISEREKLEQKVPLLTKVIEDKESLVQETTDALAKEKEKFELLSQELGDLRFQITQQQISISKNNEELQFVKGDLIKALEMIEMDKGVISKLREQLEIATKKLREVDEEKSMLLSISQQQQNTLSLVETREREHRKQINSIIVLIQGLSKAVNDFEYRATEDIKMNSFRLETLSSQLSSLMQKANTLRKTELLNKQRLEKRCSDLEKAEAEVDLLGDEVDALLSLLEKIYIALDHYSPILQHYPGIMEILKLVRRELSGESVKPI
ncbi:WPP domain-associated protein isoform X1 [Manihot esculenta]|uniref:WPP domain-associated protein n=6 Tax=Manihot esculenta TaxID=3983 RepID=A0A251KMM4_MANES|nr:WPP domain-associated protein isoform X1 [Manihot esculenta]XP_021615747.1 WPP domain-associated protein isoform X1 [Manihot esculenta]XP_021615748.1 WPP domain-associated protein isoform X1 [Manihot esculenta]XP_043813401.1 WPP domain-associated protein isoform X1 [Manihot esculenta]KAG8652118.1 hypothetical protein MANES_06G068100v8 [Manihot esculenta]KAG8652119.1 hypothetical protein MANES_06G068100v8 [Manihot esculenta]KAG8652120.1 hypothetical protein MANES_06G068100v8 [Manihot escule